MRVFLAEVAASHLEQPFGRWRRKWAVDYGTAALCLELPLNW